MSLVHTVNQIYAPVFDENTSTYKDKCPYKDYERNRIHYSCPCKAGVVVTCKNLYSQHIKSKTHKEYLKNFMIYNKPLADEQKLTKQLKYDNEILFRKNAKMIKAIQILEPDIKSLKRRVSSEETINQQYSQSIVNQQLRATNMKTEFEKLIKEKDVEIERLSSIINDINDYEYKPGDFDNDDNPLFYDCKM